MKLDSAESEPAALLNESTKPRTLGVVTLSVFITRNSDWPELELEKLELIILWAIRESPEAAPSPCWLEVTEPVFVMNGREPPRATSQTMMISLWCLEMNLATPSKIKRVFGDAPRKGDKSIVDCPEPQALGGKFHIERAVLYFDFVDLLVFERLLELSLACPDVPDGPVAWAGHPLTLQLAI